mmetsp:Transcript_5001/g.12553  ORF Transcript_5001/g.12553 Transcript_5001/m.12553 type:complete len:111 (-) Transcript_5001:515-847(-)
MYASSGTCAGGIRGFLVMVAHPSGGMFGGGLWARATPVFWHWELLHVVDSPLFDNSPDGERRVETILSVTGRIRFMHAVQKACTTTSSVSSSPPRAATSTPAGWTSYAAP